MTSTRARTAWPLLAGLAIVIVAGVGISALLRGNPSADRPRVASLEEAVAVDILDREVLDDLRADGQAFAHVSFDFAALLARVEEQFPELIGQLRDPDRLAAIDRALAEAKLQLRRVVGDDSIVSELVGFPGVTLRFRSEADLLEAVRIPVVTSIRANREFATHVVESKAIVRAGEVHQQGFAGQGTYVAVLDTGVDQTGYEQYFPAGSIAESYRAKDPYGGDADGSATPAGHGTHVSSTVLAMAPETRILSIEVFRMTFLIDPKRGLLYEPRASDGRIKDGITHVLDLKRQYLLDPTKCCNVVAMNLSLGLDTHELAACGDDYGFGLARELGIVPVVSSGNGAMVEDSSAPGGERFVAGVGDPACNPQALSVGATTDGAFAELYRPETREYCEPSSVPDVPTTFSQTGELLRMLAPGNCIVAARGAFQGTSMAAPHVAGAVAALASADSDASPEEIIEALTTTGEPITDARTVPSTTRNRLDMVEALEMLQGDPAPGPVLGEVRAVSVEPDEVATRPPLARGESRALQRIGIWNRGTAATEIELMVTDGGSELVRAAPAEWFTLDPGRVTLDPGQLSLVAPRLEVPGDAEPGSYAARIQAVRADGAGGLSDSVLVIFDVTGDPGLGGAALGTDDEGSSVPIVLIGIVVVAAVAGFLVMQRLRRRAT